MEDKILITDAAGYLGSVICEHLLDAGYKVTAIDNLAYGQNSLFHLCANPAFDLVQGDVRDEGLMQGWLKEVDAIIPVAAVVGTPACKRNPWLAKSVNLEAVNQALAESPAVDCISNQ